MAKTNQFSFRVYAFLGAVYLVTLNAFGVLFDKAITAPVADANLAHNAVVTESSYAKQGPMEFKGALLQDGQFDGEGSWQLDPQPQAAPWVRFDFGQPTTFRSVRIYWLPFRRGNPQSFPAYRLKAGDNPANLSEVYSAQAGATDQDINSSIYAGKTISFKPVKARYFQFELQAPIKRFCLQEIEVFDQAPPFRTRHSDPRDTQIRLREFQKPDVFLKHGALTVWTTSGMEKVFRDDCLSPDSVETPGKPVRLYAAKGEAEVFQVVLHHPNGVKSATVNAGAFEGPSQIPAEAIEINPVEYVFVQVASTNLRCTIQGQQKLFGPGFYPEVLLKQTARDVLPGKHQPFWITVKVPDNAPMGLYQGKVTVKAGGTDMQVPVELRVWNFALAPPQERNLVNVFTFDGYEPKTRAQHVTDKSKEIEYWRNTRRATANLGRVCFSSMTPALVTRDAADNLTYDWTPFDAEVEWCMKELGVREFTLPFDYLAYHQWMFSPQQILGTDTATTTRRTKSVAGSGAPSDQPEIEPGSERWFKLIEQAFTKYAAHLKEKGWTRNFYFFVYDEPDNAVLAPMLRIVEMAKRVDPGIRLILHSHPWTPELMSRNEIHVVNPRHHWYSFYARILKQGWTSWTYANGASLIDGPPNSSRILPWGYFKYGITGMTWHSMDDWHDEGPWQAPNRYSTWSCSSAFIFPNPDNPIDALRTVRWEQWRDGMEDHELLIMLDKLSAKAVPEKRAAAEKLLTRAKDIVTDYGFEIHATDQEWFSWIFKARGGATQSKMSPLKPDPKISFEDNPQVVLGLRREIGEMVEKLSKP